VGKAESEGIEPAMRTALEYLRIMMLGNAKKKQKHRAEILVRLTALEPR
jgi:hypothetical protein